MMNIGIESVELENDILSTKYLFIADNNCSLLYFLVLKCWSCFSSVAASVISISCPFVSSSSEKHFSPVVKKKPWNSLSSLPPPSITTSLFSLSFNTAFSIEDFVETSVESDVEINFGLLCLSVETLSNGRLS